MDYSIFSLKRDGLESLAIQRAPTSMVSDLIDIMDLLADDELLSIIQGSEINLVDGIQCPKQRFKLLFGYVRQQGSHTWNQSEIESYCIANGKTGRAILYALEFVDAYAPVQTAQAQRDSLTK